MTEYLKDLERREAGDDMPPINLGPFDNPLLWNKLDPYGADRSHQRRPSVLSRSMMELYNIPLQNRDHCAHRFLPVMKCMQTVKAATFGTIWCSEFTEAWLLCQAYESYRFELLKEKFMEYSKNYTTEEKNFFPSVLSFSYPFTISANLYWTFVASERLSGWDERDPANPLMNREPNRAYMRKLANPTEWEQSIMTAPMLKKRIDDEVVHDMVPGFPLPEDKRPTESS